MSDPIVLPSFTKYTFELPKLASGVYCFRNATTNHAYVGGSRNIRTRLQVHHFLIDNKTAPHAILAGFPNGSAEMRFAILERCAPSQLDSREAFWIGVLSPQLNTIDGGATDWTLVDWSHNDADIARQLGKSRERVRQVRSSLGLPPSRGNIKSGVKR